MITKLPESGPIAELQMFKAVVKPFSFHRLSNTKKRGFSDAS